MKWHTEGGRHTLYELVAMSQNTWCELARNGLSLQHKLSYGLLTARARGRPLCNIPKGVHVPAGCGCDASQSKQRLLHIGR